MLQFNLLPDVKKKYIAAKRQKRIILSVSTLAAVGSVVIVMLLFSFVQFAQKKTINDLSEDIKNETAALRSIEDLDKILTIQRQLESLPELHEQKPESSRIFQYLTQLTPSEVKIRSVVLDLETNTIIIEGFAPSLALVNRFTDTIKFSKFKAVTTPVNQNELTQLFGETSEQAPFNGVATELSRNEDASTYSISFNFDPLLFDNTQSVQLIIPEIVTTRSTQGRPQISNNDANPLFEDSGGTE